jgi:hemoglobin-like flavoprotein
MVMVTSRQKALVQDSFVSLAPVADDVMALFYGRLFELDPAIRQMFPDNMVSQRRKLAQMLTAAVKGLDRLDQLVPVLQDLGRRHAGYGVTENHFATVGAALLWTLEKGLGRAFTPELKDAWATVYGLVATVMTDAMRRQAEAA